MNPQPDPSSARARIRHSLSFAAAVAACMSLATPSISAQGRIQKLLEGLGPDVRTFDTHITTLANPFLGGRLPGTRGMEIAKEYMEYWFTQGGLEPGFKDARGQPTWRQEFLLGQRKTVVTKSVLRVGDMSLERGKDYNVTGLGNEGDVTGKLVFCGYGITGGPDGYESFDEDTDLTGKIAVVLRFEPFGANGKSKWSENAWSRYANLQGKLRNLSRRGADAIVLVNTPGASDARLGTIYGEGQGGGRAVGVPVLHATPDAGKRLVAAAGGDLAELVAGANKGTMMRELGEATVEAGLRRDRLKGENIGALVRGRGSLADQWVIVGAHLDHLGFGAFGSRRGRGELHPGADDNASGAAGILMIGAKLVQRLKAIPEDKPMRNVLFLAFSGEESGLVGSRHYVREPVAPLDKHALMINFDMIGRMKDSRLAVYGVDSAKGMRQWLTPLMNESGLTCVSDRPGFAGSDHLPFLQKRVPYLFSIIADFHDDYHTPDDVSWRIDRESAVKAINMYAKITEEAAFREGDFEWQQQQRRRTRRRRNAPSGARRRVVRDSAPANRDSSGTEPARGAADARPTRSAIRVQFGIKPAYSEEGVGVPVDGITEGTAAAEAGIRAGDRLMTWNGKQIADIRSWMGMLMKHKPGDTVQVGIKRGTEMIKLPVKLKAAR